MYNDSTEYLKFIRENNFTLATEDIVNTSKLNLDTPALNQNQNWQAISDEYNKNKIVVVDNFLNVEYALRLRKFMLFINFYHDIYKDYAALNFLKEGEYLWFGLLENITTEIKEKFDFLKDKNFTRAWSFIYDNVSNGVEAHADPAAVNFNFWATPEECLIMKKGNNGLDVWPVYPPKDWTWHQYNAESRKIEEFIKDSKVISKSIDYKFNRVTIFDSLFFHKTQPVVSKDGYENKRINYTFLYK